MNFTTLKKSLVGIFGVALLLVGAGATTAQARPYGFYGGHVGYYRPYGFYRSYGFYRPFWGPYWNSTVTVVDPIEQQRDSGYSDGHKRGKDDAEHGLPNDPQSHDHFSKSDHLTYRQAFLQGYADGYREERG